LKNESWDGSDRYLREAMFGPDNPRAAHFENDRYKSATGIQVCQALAHSERSANIALTQKALPT
jgi:hypothetical protein